MWSRAQPKQKGKGDEKWEKSVKTSKTTLSTHLSSQLIMEIALLHSFRIQTFFTHSRTYNMHMKNARHMRERPSDPSGESSKFCTILKIPTRPPQLGHSNFSFPLMPLLPHAPLSSTPPKKTQLDSHTHRQASKGAAEKWEKKRMKHKLKMWMGKRNEEKKETKKTHNIFFLLCSTSVDRRQLRQLFRRCRAARSALVFGVKEKNIK